jgi:hypothetical protein
MGVDLLTRAKDLHQLAFVGRRLDFTHSNVPFGYS